MSPRSHVGVTLIEVVSVLSIIAVVAAVLFPVFQKVRRSSGPSCLNRMQMLGLAYSQYEQGNDQMLPAGINAVGNGWAGELYPFVNSKRSYHCRNDYQDGNYISYAENQNLVKQNSMNLPAPAATVALYEFTTLNCDPAAAETVSATGLSAPQDSKRHDSSNFPYGLNFLAVDGHVKFYGPTQVSGGPNAVRAKTLPQGAYVETFAIK